MNMREFVELLAEKFKVDIKIENKGILKSAILLSFLITFGYIFLSTVSLFAGMAIFSKITLIAAFAYLMIFIDFCRNYISRWAEKFGFRRYIRIITDLILTLFLFISFVVVLVIVILPVPNAVNAMLSFLIGIGLFVLPYMFFEKILDFFHERYGHRIFRIDVKKMMKGKKIILLLAMSSVLVFGYATAQNETDPFSSINNAIDTFQGAVGTIQTIGSYVGKFLELTSSVKNFFSGIGLDSLQSNAIIIITALIFVYFFLRILKWIVKWTVVFMILWVTLQVVGII